MRSALMSMAGGALLPNLQRPHLAGDGLGLIRAGPACPATHSHPLTPVASSATLALNNYNIVITPMTFAGQLLGLPQ
jgi:hypothetical protein